MTGLIVPRTDALLRRFEMTWAGRRPGWLDRIEAGVRDRIWDASMWTPSIGPQPIALRGHTIEQDLGPTLSAAGEALGLDLGLLLGRSFADELDGDARWIIGSHGRTYVSDKLPVLRGRGKAEYDPILIGLNLGSAVPAGPRRQGRMSDRSRSCTIGGWNTSPIQRRGTTAS